MKDKKYRKVRDHCHYTGVHRGPVHRICNLKYSVPKNNSIVFHNGSNYDYHFIIKELAEEFEKQFTCLGENTEKYIRFAVPIGKEVTRIDKNLGKNYKKHMLHITVFLIAKDLWQAHDQILLMIYLKEFIELNVNLDTIIKHVNLVELNISTVTVFLSIKL